MTDETGDSAEERTTVTIRRAPKFSVFVVVGALLGFLVTLVLTSLFPTDPEVGFAASFGYFSLYGVSFGVVIGAGLALAFDRRASRRATEVIAGKLTMHVEEEPSPVQGSDGVPDRDSDSSSDSDSVPNNDSDSDG